MTGSQEAGETLAATATRELREETGIDAGAYGGVVDWGMTNVFDIYPKWQWRYRRARRTTPSTCSASPCPAGSRRARAARASAPRVAAVARSRGQVFFVDQPRGDRGAARARGRIDRE